MKKLDSKPSYMLTGYATRPGHDPERIYWHASTLEAARLLVDRAGYVLTRCDIWQLVDEISPKKEGDK